MGWSWAPFGKGLGRCWASLGSSWGALGVLLGRFWELLWRTRALLGILGCSWSASGSIFGFLLHCTQLELKFKINSCLCLLWFAWACVCATKCGTDFELELRLTLLLALTCFCLLLDAVSAPIVCFGCSYCLLWLLCLLALSVPLLLRFENMKNDFERQDIENKSI